MKYAIEIDCTDNRYHSKITVLSDDTGDKNFVKIKVGDEEYTVVAGQLIKACLIATEQYKLPRETV